MLYAVTVSRLFTSGNLEGLTIEQTLRRVSKPGKIGDVFTYKRAIGGGSYVDTTTRIELEL